MHDIGFELTLLMIFCGAIMFAIFVLYPLFEVLVQKWVWQSKKPVKEILKGIF